MGAINTGSIAKALQPGVNKFWGLGYGEEPLQLTSIFETSKSKKAYEEDVQLIGTGLFAQKTEGGATSYDSMRQGYVQRYSHLIYSLGVIFTEEMLEDKQYKLGLEKVKQLGFSARQTQEIVAANILNRAFNSSYTWADGVELCSTAHVNVSGGTFKNELTTAADLSHASIEQALIDIRDFKDDRGLNIPVRGKKLIIPVELEWDAKRILNSVQESGTANNDTNVLKGALDLVVNDYLTDPNAWFIKTNCMNGLKRFQRIALAAPKRENDFDTGNLKFKARYRESYGVTDVRTIFGSPGA
jgi:hypothetical protein